MLLPVMLTEQTTLFVEAPLLKITVPTVTEVGVPVEDIV
jgi:hypothetical protein